MKGTPVTVRAVSEVGPDTVALELESPPNFDPLPGQFVLLRAVVDGAELARHYTLSSPDAEGTFELTVGVDPEGDLSPWLAGLEAGDTVHVEGPMGVITYEGDADAVAVAGGPGIGPAIAVAESALEAGHTAAVVYRDETPVHRDRLRRLEDRGVPVTILGPGTGDKLADAIARHATDGELFVFGFRSFVEDVREALAAAGVDPEAANIENFG